MEKKAFEEKFLQYTYLLFSPGPGIPSDFPLMFNLLENYQEHQRILGICLGHQAIGEFLEEISKIGSRPSRHQIRM